MDAAAVNGDDQEFEQSDDEEDFTAVAAATLRPNDDSARTAFIRNVAFEADETTLSDYLRYTCLLIYSSNPQSN